MVGTRTAVDIGKVADTVSAAVEPDTGFPLGELGLVDGVSDDRGGVRVRVRALTSDEHAHAALRMAVRSAAGPVSGDVAVDVVALSDTERADLGARLRSSSGRPGELGSRTAVYAVASGKGGVGKSTVTANLAAALAARGKTVGVLDADVWGYSQPQLFGVLARPVALRGLMLPVAAHGVRLMSIGFFVDDEQPVVWRGPMLHKAMEQFLTDVHWGELDVLLVDLPPGTGDVTLSVLELLPDAALLAVTTPQRAAERVAARVGKLAVDSSMPVAGVVENMTQPTGGEVVFGTGGGDALAAAVDAPVLARVPLAAEVCAAGDAGTPLVCDDPDGAAALALAGLAENLPAPRRSMAGRSLPLFVS